MVYLIKRLENARFSDNPTPPSSEKTVLVTVMMLTSKLNRSYGDFYTSFVFHPDKANVDNFPDALRQAAVDYIRSEAGQKRFEPEEDDYTVERLGWFDVIGDIPVDVLAANGITPYGGFDSVQADSQLVCALSNEEYFTKDGTFHDYRSGGEMPF